MNACSTLSVLYGRDTKAAQVMNIFLCVIWGAAMLAHDTGIVVVDMPSILCNNHTNITYISCVAIIFAVLGFFTNGRRHQVFKFFGLSVGCVLQAILANAYFSAYPPLDMILVILIVILIWQLGALSYIVSCEGFDGTVERRR